MKMSMDQFLDGVRSKLSTPEVQHMIQFGETDPNLTAPLRNMNGVNETINTIMSSTANMYKLCNGRDVIADMVTNFADTGVGYTDVSNVQTVGAIDLTIIAMSQSLIPYVCMDRGMPTPDATIYYQDLVAQNSAGGATAGDIVNGNFLPPNVKLNLGLPTVSETVAFSSVAEAADGYAVDLGLPLVPGKVSVTLSDGSNSVVGQDFNKDGNIYFSGASTVATIDYATGIVTIVSLTGYVSAVVSSIIDSTKDNTGGSTLRVYPKYRSLFLESVPQNIVLENNILDAVFMQKTFSLQSTGSDPYNKVLFQRIKNTYIDYVNAKVILGLLASATTAELRLDLSTYSFSDFAATKNDLVSQLISNMGTVLLRKSGVGMTALIINSYASALLSNIPVLFVKAPNADKAINGLVGYFSGTPVFRHNTLDNDFTTPSYSPSTKAVFLGVYRNADNSSASQVYGEFIPLTSTGSVGNFALPLEISQGYFSMIANKVVADNLVVRGEITTPTAFFSNVGAL